MNLSRLAEHLEVDFQTDVVPIIIGSTGIGKSEAVQQVADKLGMTLIDLRMGEMGDACDVFGLPTVVADGNERRTIWSKPTWRPRSEDMNRPHILFLDEMNRAPDRETLQTIFKLLLKKQVHEEVLPASWKVCAAMNPNTDEYYVQDLDLALQTRFIHYKINCDAKCWIDWAYKNKVNQNVIDFVSTDNSFLHNEKGKNNPRTWTLLARLIDKMEELNKMDMLFEKAEGLLDATTAATFKRFVEGNLQRPIAAKEILTKFEKVKPQLTKYLKGNKMDLLYASNTELAHYDAAELMKNIKNLTEYILWLPVELGYSLLKLYMDNESVYLSLFNKLTDNEQIMKFVKSVDYTES